MHLTKIAEKCNTPCLEFRLSWMFVLFPTVWPFYGICPNQICSGWYREASSWGTPEWEHHAGVALSGGTPSPAPREGTLVMLLAITIRRPLPLRDCNHTAPETNCLVGWLEGGSWGDDKYRHQEARDAFSSRGASPGTNSQLFGVHLWDLLPWTSEENKSSFIWRTQWKVNPGQLVVPRQHWRFVFTCCQHTMEYQMFRASKQFLHFPDPLSLVSLIMTARTLNEPCHVRPDINSKQSVHFSAIVSNKNPTLLYPRTEDLSWPMNLHEAGSVPDLAVGVDHFLFLREALPAPAARHAPGTQRHHSAANTQSKREYISWTCFPVSQLKEREASGEHVMRHFSLLCTTVSALQGIWSKQEHAHSRLTLLGFVALGLTKIGKAWNKSQQNCQVSPSHHWWQTEIIP